MGDPAAAPVGIATVVDLLACPNCRKPLALGEDGRGVRCERGHRFDLARQGYLNLSGGPQPANADTASMVAARERFLARGGLDPVRDAVLRLVGDAPGLRVLDAGAGTGRLLAAVLSASPGRRGVAVDVSTAAARRAARAHPALGAVVADVWHRLPLADRTFDVVLSNFAPRNPPEFARVLVAGGRLVTVTPTTSHLSELRTTYGLLGIEPAKADRLLETLGAWMVPEITERVERRSRWSTETVQDAIAMGPNAFHDAAGRPAAAPADVTISVDLRSWRLPDSGRLP
ncbi:MAG TPA: methyltransferase domain-containing protein [Microlunatus sp.]|nr:methyltransferase domain-containing protein [Microlunatus sp.]